MAEDTIVLLDYLGWTSKRDVHVVGISLGGMIAQELATRIPDRIASLTLAVTTAGGKPWTNLPPWKGFSSLTRLMTITDPHVKVPVILDMIFPETWLAEQAMGDAEGRTNREVQTDIYLHRIEITRPQALVGALSQMSAAITHHVTPARLSQISSSIPKIAIVTGDQDNLVTPSNSAYLKKQMKEAEYIVFENTGHGIHAQRKEQFNALLERVIRESRDRSIPVGV
jgi:pimeloyl-ACP methyl ester carboxylesterase